MQESSDRAEIGRRALLTGAGVTLAAGVGYGLYTSLDGGATAPSAAVTSAPLPDRPGDYRYAVAGTADAPLEVTYYGSWKCPHCGTFSTGFLGELITDYVDPGDVRLVFRDLAYYEGDPFLGPDAPAAGHAGLAVWNNDPEAYWAYHEQVMANQPPADERWATADRLVAFAEAAGVSTPAAVREAVQTNAYAAALAATDEVARTVGVTGTPQLEIDGTVVSPFEEGRTRDLIEAALP
ncbi:MAG: thioredoxin domain-containing protein [Halobacteriaceae archaeon]